MKQIVDYTIAYDVRDKWGNLEIDLVAIVKKLILKGWQPLGAATTSASRGGYMQTMVKYAEICEHQYRVKRYGTPMSGYDQVECMLCGQLPTVTG